MEYFIFCAVQLLSQLQLSRLKTFVYRQSLSLRFRKNYFFWKVGLVLLFMISSVVFYCEFQIKLCHLLVWFYQVQSLPKQKVKINIRAVNSIPLLIDFSRCPSLPKFHLGITCLLSRNNIRSGNYLIRFQSVFL